MTGVGKGMGVNKWVEAWWSKREVGEENTGCGLVEKEINTRKK